MPWPLILATRTSWSPNILFWARWDRGRSCEHPITGTDILYDPGNIWSDEQLTEAVAWLDYSSHGRGGLCHLLGPFLCSWFWARRCSKSRRTKSKENLKPWPLRTTPTRSLETSPFREDRKFLEKKAGGGVFPCLSVDGPDLQPPASWFSCDFRGTSKGRSTTRSSPPATFNTSLLGNRLQTPENGFHRNPGWKSRSNGMDYGRISGFHDRLKKLMD